MPPESPRRLNLLDGMIVMAGLAGCFLLTRLYIDQYYLKFVKLVSDFESRSACKTMFTADWYVGEAGKVATLWLALISPVLLLIRLRRPRPDRTQLLAQPGASATVAATVITALGIILWTAASAIEGQGPGLFFYSLSFSRFLDHAGSAIAVCWSSLALSRRWAPEPGTIDRAGRLLGVCWIVLFLAMTWSRFHQKALLESMPSIDRDFYESTNRMVEM